MAGLLDRRNNLLNFFSDKQNLIPPPRREPTSSQNESNEVDDAGNMDYRFEEIRLRSFEGWSSPHVRPEALAAAGFYYTGQIDRVRCFECNVDICSWQDGDDPMSEHQRWGGRCRFIRKQPCGNVPIGADPSTIPLPRPRSRDVCGAYSLEYRLGAEADTHSASTSSSEPNERHQQQPMPSVSRLSVLGLAVAKKPDFPEYASYEARFQSFQNWPPSMAQKKEDMAEAGFFYTGYSDETKCYQCGGGLKNWEPQDDPWTQHAKWFSTCYYLILVKGQEFINTVTGKCVPPLSEEETKNLSLPSFIKKVDTSVQQNQESGEGSTTQEVQSTVEPEQLQTQQHERENIFDQTETSSPEPQTGVQNQNEPVSSVKTTSIPANSTSLASNDSQQPNEKKSVVDNVCKICYNEELGVIFLPCGHIVACVNCAPGILTCAVCREPVSLTARAFIT